LTYLGQKWARRETSLNEDDLDVLDDEDRESLRQLRELFAARLPERLAEVDAAWDEARGAAFEPAALARFHRLVHSLSGAGATFGFPAVTAVARRMERLLKPLVREKAAPSPIPEGAERELAGLLDELREAARPSPP
jgi:HPt (histidine-containing phosphotransfer) domain-containing protein